ncbi:MAG: iron-containing alcohol dehydrogenase [Oscillospiraceae bacterium]|nr:iron-containing alcohol dehydrogenase [Oscillospiraceae bacterium]
MTNPTPTVYTPFDAQLKGSKLCSCGYTHNCRLRRFSVAESDVWLLLPPLLKKLKGSRVHFISDAVSMQRLGEQTMQYLGSLGFTVSSSVFPADTPPVCDHVAAGSLLLHIPQQAEALIAVGERAVCDLAKFAALKNDLPLVLLPTAACTDSFAQPTAEFLENDHRVRLPAAVPHAILADLSVLVSAAPEQSNAGIGAALANYVSLADWRLSAIAAGSPCCETLAEGLQTLTDRLLALLRQGRSVHDSEVQLALINCLVGAGVTAQLAGTDAPIRGSESALAYYLEHKLVAEDITDYSFDVLRGLSALYALRMYEWLRTTTPDFAAAQSLFDDFGWTYWGAELFRVYGDYAHTLLSRFGGDGFYSRDTHRSRLARFQNGFLRLRGETAGNLPAYSLILSQLRALSVPCTMADIGFTREEALDALVWSKEMLPRYGIFRFLADLGELERAAGRLTETMPR